MSRLNHVVGLVLVLLATLLIFSLLPLGMALEIGGDEGYELMKGFLCSKGFVMYKDIWCDQPPLYPKLLGWLFQVFGPSLLVARLTAAGFALLFVTVVYELVRQRSTTTVALATAFFLLASPGTLFLSISVMVEVPTLATALVSALLVLQWTERRRWWWLIASGVVMGLALEIKLTAAMVLPAILAEIMLAKWNPWSRNDTGSRVGGSRAGSASGSGQMRASGKALMEYGLAAAIAFSAVALIWGRGSLQSSWRSHTVVQPVPGLSSAADFRFEPTILLDHLECLLVAPVAIVILGRQRRWRELRLPVLLLLTAIIVHSLHRPWWSYYYLHLAVPLAWLSGLMVGEVVKSASEFCFAPRKGTTRWAWAASLGACALAALALAVSEARLEAGIRSIRQSPRAEQSPLLAAMKQFAPATRWAYSQPVIYPFQAGLPVPPEIAVVVLKRYWSGQITPKEIVEVCRRYQPEQLVLYKARAGGEWKELLAAEYRPVYEDTNCVLYVAKRIWGSYGSRKP